MTLIPKETAIRSRLVGTPFGKSLKAGLNPPADSTNDGSSLKLIASSNSPDRLSVAKPSMPTKESRSRARIIRNFSWAS